MAEDMARSTSQHMRQGDYLTAPSWQMVRERNDWVRAEGIVPGSQTPSSMSMLRQALEGLRQTYCSLWALDVDLMERCVTQRAKVIHRIPMFETLDVTDAYPLKVQPCQTQALEDGTGGANWSLMVSACSRSYRQTYFSNE